MHPQQNIEKMAGSIPLTDADRKPWLHRIAQEIDGFRQRGEGVVMTCSALKRAYRDIILGDRRDVTLVYLKGPRELIHLRMVRREGHFMPVDLLESQFATLEEPSPDEDPITIDIGGSPVDTVAQIVRELEERETERNAGRLRLD